jgi:anti-sigma B factor antagonist
VAAALSSVGRLCRLRQSVFDQEVCAMSRNDDHSPSVSVEDRDGVRLVTLCGEHDLSTSAEVTAACAGPPEPTVVDLSAATFIDSTVISTLAAAHTANQNAGFAIVVAPESPPEWILALVLADTVPTMIDKARALDLVTAQAHLQQSA